MTEYDQGGALLPHRAWAFTLLLLIAVYASGISTNPPKWEEPRRSLVAMEMIERGDYVVPRLLGEPYRAKPPFQAWTIALVSGLDVRRAGATSARLVSLGSWLGILFMLWRLGIDGRRGRPHLLPPLIFATTATVVQFSRTGEIDLLFCFFVTAAWTAFEVGRRHGARWTQWTLSQVMVALGFLTKGLAPLFFYPPVLFCTWMRRRSGIRFSIPAFLLGTLLAIAVATAWLWPYSRMAPTEELQSRWAYELWRLTSGHGWLGFARHLATYPFLVLGVAAPWSLIALLWGADGWSRLGRLWREDPFLITATATVGWGVLVYLGIPGTDGRYLIPVLPFASVVLARMIVDGESVLRRRLAVVASNRAFWGITAFLFAAWVAIGGWDLAPDLRIRVGWRRRSPSA
jgi:4-amino-4-deoxy-L-arabinose transferase-like glycosyltransferase